MRCIFIFPSASLTLESLKYSDCESVSSLPRLSVVRALDLFSCFSEGGLTFSADYDILLLTELDLVPGNGNCSLLTFSQSETLSLFFVNVPYIA